MTRPAGSLRELVAARYLRRGDLPSAAAERPWSRDALAGRLVELCAASAPARLTAAFGLVVETQRAGDNAVWITASHGCFFPPDAEEGGADLDTLAVVRLASASDIPAAADKLIRSGAFGLVVMDLSRQPHPSHARAEARREDGWGARLAGLARRNDTAVIVLTAEGASSASLGPLVSLKGEARRTSPPVSLHLNAEEGRKSAEAIETRWGVEVRILKDKHRAPGWSHEEPCRGPVGLR